MKLLKQIIITGAVIGISACSSTKKSTKTTVSSSPAAITTATITATSTNSATTAAPVTPTLAAVPTETTASKEPAIVKPANGMYMPGNEELAAIQMHFINVTLDQLKEGYTLYTKGACINCHNAKTIYRYNEKQWGMIIDNMAPMAKISDAEKDAVYKYVLAIKATQPK